MLQHLRTFLSIYRWFKTMELQWRLIMACYIHVINALVQEKHNSSALAMVLCLSRINPSIP